MWHAKEPSLLNGHKSTLLRQWWSPQMSEKFSSGTENSKQSNQWQGFLSVLLFWIYVRCTNLKYFIKCSTFWFWKNHKVLFILPVYVPRWYIRSFKQVIYTSTLYYSNNAPSIQLNFLTESWIELYILCKSIFFFTIT